MLTVMGMLTVVATVVATPTEQIGDWCYCNPRGTSEWSHLAYLQEVFQAPDDPTRMAAVGGVDGMKLHVTDSESVILTWVAANTPPYHIVSGRNSTATWLFGRISDLMQTEYGTDDAISIVSMMDLPAHCTALPAVPAGNIYKPMITLDWLMAVGYIREVEGVINTARTVVLKMQFTSECEATEPNTFWTTGKLSIVWTVGDVMTRELALGGDPGNSLLSRVTRVTECVPDTTMSPRWTTESGPFQLDVYYPVDSEAPTEPRELGSLSDMADCTTQLTQLTSRGSVLLATIAWPPTDLDAFGDVFVSILSPIVAYNVSILYMDTFEHFEINIGDLVMIRVHFQGHPSATSSEMIKLDTMFFLFIDGETAEIYTNATDGTESTVIGLDGLASRDCVGHVYTQQCPAIPSLTTHHWSGNITRVNKYGINPTILCPDPVQILCPTENPPIPPPQSPLTFVADVAMYHTVPVTLMLGGLACIIAAWIVNLHHPHSEHQTNVAIEMTDHHPTHIVYTSTVAASTPTGATPKPAAPAPAPTNVKPTVLSTTMPAHTIVKTVVIKHTVPKHAAANPTSAAPASILLPPATLVTPLGGTPPRPATTPSRLTHRPTARTGATVIGPDFFI